MSVADTGTTTDASHKQTFDAEFDAVGEDTSAPTSDEGGDMCILSYQKDTRCPYS